MDGIHNKPAGNAERTDAEPVSSGGDEGNADSIFLKKPAFECACKTKRKQLPYLRCNAY